jgi:hypothetical protein
MTLLLKPGKANMKLPTFVMAQEIDIFSQLSPLDHPFDHFSGDLGSLVLEKVVALGGWCS